MRGIAAVLLAILPPAEPLVDCANSIEVNHVVRDDGQPAFVQVIFWHWDGERVACRDWRTFHNATPAIRRDADGGWLIWNDGDVLRKVRFFQIRETWTMHDPEVNDRSLLPAECRRKLLRREK